MNESDAKLNCIARVQAHVKWCVRFSITKFHLSKELMFINVD
jgi:hypothetical protein